MLELLAIFLNKGDKMLEKYEASPRVRRLVWLVLGAVYLFALAAFIGALKWW